MKEESKEAKRRMRSWTKEKRRREEGRGEDER